MTGTASRARNPILRSQSARRSPFSIGKLKVATPRARSNTTSLCSKLRMRLVVYATKQFCDDGISILHRERAIGQQSPSSRRATKNSYLRCGCCRYRQFKYSALLTVHVPRDEPIRPANSEYSDVQGASSSSNSTPGTSADVRSASDNAKFAAAAAGRERIRAGKTRLTFSSARNTLAMRTEVRNRLDAQVPIDAQASWCWGNRRPAQTRRIGHMSRQARCSCRAGPKLRYFVAMQRSPRTQPEPRLHRNTSAGERPQPFRPPQSSFS